MNLNDFLNNNKHKEPSWLTKRCEMNDGFHISIQANEFAYCEPRGNVSADMYYSFDLGYPSEIDELINVFAEVQDTTETVYPYVEREIVQKLIDKHGGIKGAFSKELDKE